MVHSNLVVRLMATACIAGWMIPATAQPMDQDRAATVETGGLGDIVVTAQKREERLQDVPIAISAIGADFLRSRDIGSIDQIGTIAPNVKVERSPTNKTVSQIAMRGSVTVNPSVLFEPAVGLYVDGVYIAKAQGSIFDIADLERVEVLRGPQGTLYGRNTLAGAINLVTRKPSGELRGSIEASYGNYDMKRVKGTIDLPAFGIFSIKLSGQAQKRDGFIDVVPNPYPQAFLARPSSVDDTNDLNQRSLFAQVRVRPADSLTIDYAYDYSRYRQRPDFAQLHSFNRNGLPQDIFDPNSPGYAGAGAFFPLDLYVRTQRQSSASLDADQLYERLRTDGHSLTLAWDLGTAELKSISAHRRTRWSDALDLDGSPLPVGATQRFTRYRSFSQELQLTGGVADGRLKYVVGGYYFRDKGETLGPQSFFAGATSFQADYGQHTRAAAAYAQVDFDLTDRLVLTGGIRYNHERKDVSRLLVSGPGTPAELTLIDIGYGDVPDAVYNSFSPAASLRFDLTERVNVYARYARGFKSGGFNGETTELVAATAACPSGAIELCQPYRPEKVDSYEVGLKSRLLDNRLQLNIAAFWDEHRDIQLSVFRGSGALSLSVLNAASSRIRGVELEFTARPSSAFTVSGSFALLDAKYKRFIDGGVDVSDNRAFPHAPRYTASVSTDWRVIEGDWGRLNLLADLNFVDSYYTYPYALAAPPSTTQVAGNSEAPSRAIVNARAILADLPIGGMKGEISLWARNLFQQRSPSNFIDFGPSFGGMTLAFYPDPRTFGATFGLRF
ncbi:TonB-dependent receptor [Rhizorhabdus wittichii]|uniref:TonB-dependent receptor n=2 Tax=Rhizorhabdus wittichii TaxID=160791 RepID=A0A975D1K6_9SPHN|nr:TonB-dependent receptor [Rhizorhabdus wittichii]